MNLLGKASKHIGGVISYNSLFVISSIIFQNNSSCDTACGVEMSSFYFFVSIEVLKSVFLLNLLGKSSRTHIGGVISYKSSFFHLFPNFPNYN